jgi:hypothetical protein
MLSAFLAISSVVSSGRVLLFPVGSPIWVVKSPAGEPPDAEILHRPVHPQVDGMTQMEIPSGQVHPVLHHQLAAAEHPGAQLIEGEHLIGRSSEPGQDLLDRSLVGHHWHLCSPWAAAPSTALIWNLSTRSGMDHGNREADHDTPRPTCPQRIEFDSSLARSRRPCGRAAGPAFSGPGPYRGGPVLRHGGLIGEPPAPRGRRPAATPPAARIGSGWGRSGRRPGFATRYPRRPPPKLDRRDRRPQAPAGRRRTDRGRCRRRSGSARRPAGPGPGQVDVLAGGRTPGAGRFQATDHLAGSQQTPPDTPSGRQLTFAHQCMP